MKIFAFYLPQFHEIPENNEWWGNGFTEWVSVKNAKPLFSGHSQPRVPLDQNYYDLTNKQIIQWQTELLKNNGLEGMIYYHYYFKGKLLLEKPAENLLAWKEIDQPFFFCWANHTWNRAWKGSRELLIRQEYGSRKDWSDHFNYLLPFFNDDRYEKIDNMPVFMIFQTEYIEKKDMFEYFDERCKENGYEGIYVIETCTTSEDSKYKSFIANVTPQTKRIFLREPDTSKKLIDSLNSKWYTEYLLRIKRRLQRNNIKFKLKKYEGDDLCNTMINDISIKENLIRGVFFEWDNTPRHSIRGYIITPISKEKFYEYMNSLKEEEYVFINAWNEWAEGMMLEPTVENGYKYLNWIKEWKISINENK